MKREPLSDVHPDWYRPNPVSWPDRWISRDRGLVLGTAWVEYDRAADELNCGNDDACVGMAVTVPGAVLRAMLDGAKLIRKEEK